ncbi:MAG: NYN domain-containing protein [Oscillochloris sp.]|nr:NYN domain-containing protein [Oscillochloris sp.]
MNPNESWFTRWVATPYQVMLRTLGQAPDLAPGEPSAELLDRAEACAPEGATPGSATGRATAPSVALLIDGENCAPSVAAHVLAKAGEFGTVRVRRVYANWAAASTRGWLEPVARHAIQPIHHEPTTTGKNATDILLTIDAMDLLHGGAIDCFCIVASDSDYTPLVARLRAAQRTVVVIGRAQTLPALVQMSSVFLTLEELTGVPALPSPPPKVTPHTPAAAPPSAAPAPKPAKAAAPAPKPAKAPAPTPKLAKAPAPTPKPAKAAAPVSKPAKAPAGVVDVGPLLIAVWEGVRQARGTVSLSNFVNELKRLHPELQPQTYGHTRLAQLIKQRDDLFTIQQDGGNPSHQIVLRALRSPVAPQQSAVRALLESAWQQAPKQDGWLPMTALGQQLKQLDPAFTPKQHGYARLGLLIQAHPDLFELRQRSAGQYDLRLIRAGQQRERRPMR